MDDENNKPVVPVEPVEPTEPQEPVEPTGPEEPAEPTEPVEPVEDPEEPEEPEVPPTPRESKRIKALTEKLANANKQKLDPANAPDAPFKQRDEGYELEEANKIAQDFGASQYEKGREEAKSLEFKLNLRIDAPKVAQKYDVMNDSSDNYDPGRTAFINELYLRTVGYDPQNGNVRDASIGYEEFVDGIMDAVDKQAAHANAETATNIAKQVSRQGTRPTGEAKRLTQATTLDK